MIDAVNACFEGLLAVLLLGNVRRLLRDRRVQGVTVWPSILTTAWGVWNLYYYPALGQWWSTVGGSAVVLMNSWWLALAWRFRRGYQ